MKWLLLVALAACGSPAEGVDGGGSSDGAAPDAALGPDAGPCGALDEDPAWLDAMLSATVAHLSATPRQTAAQRSATRDYLIAELAAQGIAADEDSYGMGANVVARMPGSVDEWLLIGAHYDTVSGAPGANDDATGVAVVLATARLLRDTCRRRGILVAFFDQEELGLIGSTYLADDLKIAGTNLIAAHTIDQVGWDDDGDRRFELELPGALASPYQTAAAALGLATSTTTTTGSDHSSFRADGFAAIGITEEYVGGDTTPYLHTPQDTFATVDLAYTADAVRLVSRVIAASAQ